MHPASSPKKRSQKPGRSFYSYTQITEMNRNIFKPHIAAGEPYRGGSTRAEVNGTTKLFKLSSNENPLGASPKAMQAIRENLAMIHEYNYQDDGRFREKLADHYCNQFTTEQFL